MGDDVDNMNPLCDRIGVVVHNNKMMIGGEVISGLHAQISKANFALTTVFPTNVSSNGKHSVIFLFM